ncbi:MAG TPA: acetate kinase [Oscillospiraceae bacterium]|nr:acetate kinase [Oscillospiraceae bacterium]
MKILVINAGSSSMKYQLFDMDSKEILSKGNCERIGIDGNAKGSKGQNSYNFKVKMDNHIEAFKVIKDILTKGEDKVLDSLSDIGAVGHRIVQGGSTFTESVLVNDEVVRIIEDYAALAPLHNLAHIQGIKACTEVLGKEVPQVVVFDTAFHSTMPKEAYTFPIPYELSEKHNIRRYGFHGTSHRYVAAKCIEILGKAKSKIITCHLGNGCSITAIVDGKVIDTSMGLTPLDGFMMGTRTGSLDPSVVTFLQRKEGLTPDETDTLLNKKSGALGISGISSDDRDLEEAAKNGNERAALARKIQQYQIRKFIGSYAAAMNGVDAIVFTGGLGENAPDIRANVCKNLSFLGIDFDDNANEAFIRGAEGEITKGNSSVRVFVIPTNEELVIAKDTLKIASLK